MAKALNKIKAVLIDLSGTLHIENEAIPGAVEALNRLRTSQLKYRFVTNTTKECRRYLHERLTRLGFVVRIEEIFTSLTAAKDIVLQRNLKPFLMLEDEALEDFVDVVVEDRDLDAVVVGLAPTKFDYENMNRAFQLLLNGAQLIAIHKARYFKKKDGLSLGPGPFVTALEFSSDVKSIVVGKPEKGFFLQALQPLGCRPEDAVMIGDDVRDDVIGAQLAGLSGCLVQTGKYREGDERKTDPAPDFVFPSFVEAIDFILKQTNQ